MTRHQATHLIQKALREFAISLPEPFDENLSLMKDLNIESVDLLNLLVSLERRLYSQIDLIQIMRGREDEQVYQRDLKIRDLADYLENQEYKSDP